MFTVATGRKPLSPNGRAVADETHDGVVGVGVRRVDDHLGDPGAVGEHDGSREPASRAGAEVAEVGVVVRWTAIRRTA